MTSAALSPDEFGAAVAAVTTAFGDPTRRDIYVLVRAHPDGLRAAEVAEEFSLHPNVARHHLEKLASGGYLLVELSRNESAGRPSKIYRAASLDTQLNFPPRRDDLLGTLLAARWSGCRATRRRRSPKTSATSTGSGSRRRWNPATVTAR